MAWVPQHFLPLKMVGFPSSESPNFQGAPIFRGKLAVSFRECIYTQVFSDQFGWIHATCCGWFGRQYAANTFRFLTSSSKHIVGHVVLAKIYVDVLMGWCGLFISLGGGFIFFMFTPTWGNDWIWLIFFNLCWNHHVIYFLSSFHIRDVTSKPIGSMVAWYIYLHVFDFYIFFIYFHGSVNIPIIPWIPSWEIAASTTTTEASLFELLPAERFSKRHRSGGSGGTKVATNLKVPTWCWMEKVGESGFWMEKGWWISSNYSNFTQPWDPKR